MFYKYTSIVYVYTAVSSLITMLGERLASLSDILVVHYWFSEAVLYWRRLEVKGYKQIKQLKNKN